jgi:hypothetical protein
MLQFSKPKNSHFNADCQWLQSDDQVRRFLVASRAKEWPQIVKEASPCGLGGLAFRLFANAAVSVR